MVCSEESRIRQSSWAPSRSGKEQRVMVCSEEDTEMDKSMGWHRDADVQGLLGGATRVTGNVCSGESWIRLPTHPGGHHFQAEDTSTEVTTAEGMRKARLTVLSPRRSSAVGKRQPVALRSPVQVHRCQKGCTPKGDSHR